MSFVLKILSVFVLINGYAVLVYAQAEYRDIPYVKGNVVEVSNTNGKVTVTASEDEGVSGVRLRVIPATAGSSVTSSAKKGALVIGVQGSDQRTDLEIKVPQMASVRVITTGGQITLSGKFARAEGTSDTGTIYADTPFSRLRYKFLWTASYPRFLSESEVSEIKEKAAGKHVIAGFAETDPEMNEDDADPVRELNLRTARGIILLNVPPSQVPNNLQPKEFSIAAKAIMQSGDSILVNAIRRSAPDLFGEYAATLQPHQAQPVLTAASTRAPIVSATKRITVQVTDINNRAFSGLNKDDFKITERGVEREILNIRQSNAPFNLLLLMDVSGSVREYVDFIRKAGRSFVNTVDPRDKVSIVIFNDDVNTLSDFTADKDALSESLDTFDAGGGTALYDAIGFGLTESLRPLKGDRTAIVILSDGDDNRSFLPFEALIGSIEESGALIYPMYVPSSLIASSGNYSSPDSLDPLRDRYLSNNLSSKAQEEGERMAHVSGGVYYPISKLSELQRAYNDIVQQLRTAYTITFRSDLDEEIGNRASPRLKVTVARNNAFVRLGPVTAVGK